MKYSVMIRRSLLFIIIGVTIFITTRLTRYVSPKMTHTADGGSGGISVENLPSDVPKWMLSGATSRVFKGEKTRAFSRRDVKFESVSTARKPVQRLEPWCTRWGVVTTIFEVSEAVRRQVRLQGWCLVVVFDKHSTPTYDTGWTEGEGHKAVVFLTPDDQNKMEDTFVDRLPWNSFGRKNIGYLYAIMHGAKFIWDFDDDNALKFWLTGAAPPGAPSLDAAVPDSDDEEITVREPSGHRWPTYNPYPVLGAPSLPSWPRGLPLDDIKAPNCSNTPLRTVHLKASSLGVLQSLAEHEPDVDAIFRLTMPLPFMFNRLSESEHLMVPQGSFTPYNAQASLHFRDAFFCLYLPITVTGRVSDIWRSYVAQRLFLDIGLRFGFMARPLVVQDRNVHSNIADLTSEIHLYTRAKQLVKFLSTWKATGKSIVSRTEELWIALYEREYFELEDVKLMQLWLQSLLDVGYRFPELIEDAPNPTLSYPLGNAPQPTNDEACTLDRHKNVTVWSSDLHVGPTPSLLASMGQNIVLTGHRRDGSSYLKGFRQKGIKKYSKLSQTVGYLYHDHSTALTEDMLRENYEFFKGDSQIASTDIFLCQFPSSWCELWMPFNKTMAIVPTHRYDLGKCEKGEWDRLNQHLQMLATSKRPRHIIGAASVYDREYLRHYTGIDPLPLYSYCGQYAMPKVGAFKPTQDEILLVSHLKDEDRFAGEAKKFKIVPLHLLYKNYTSRNVVNHRAIVYMPNSVTSYEMCELYSLGIPLFVPSVKFYRTVQRFDPDYSADLYCTMDEQMKPHPHTLHPYSPRSRSDQEAGGYWLQMSDFYQWPHITYFDSMADLEEKLESASFRRIHQLMLKELKRKKAAAKTMWCRALRDVETGRKVPQNYDTAIQQLYGVARLQVH